MNLFCKSIDPIALASLVVAICALFTTIWQAAISRKHARLSVRPMLTLYRKEFEGIIYIKNNGSGPAIVNSYEIFSKENILDLRNLDGFFPTVTDIPDLTPGVAIAAGESIEIVKARTYLEASHIEPLENLRFRISYESIYGEKHVLE